MPTSKSGSKASAAKRKTTVRSSSTAKKTATKPKAVTTKAASTSTTKTKVTAPEATAKSGSVKTAPTSANYPAIIIAEVVGTFVLTMVALASLQLVGSLYVGLTLAIMVLAIGAVSGSHLNPAVTFGLWAARKVKTSLVPVYWVAQFVGAIIAVLALGALSGSGYPLSFVHFADIHWGVLVAEAIGMAVFMFGFAAVLSNEKYSVPTKAAGIGFALTLGLVVSGTAFTTVRDAKIQEFQAEQASATADSDAADAAFPAEIYISGTTLNPAIALAATTVTDSQLNGGRATKEETRYSRLDVNTIVGTLIGAALGTNLYLLIAYVKRQNA